MYLSQAWQRPHLSCYRSTTCTLSLTLTLTLSLSHFAGAFGQAKSSLTFIFSIKVIAICVNSV